MFVDYADATIPVHDPQSGDVHAGRRLRGCVGCQHLYLRESHDRAGYANLPGWLTEYFATAGSYSVNSNWDGPTASYAKELRACGRYIVLVVDEWAMAPWGDAEWRAFLEMCDERYLTRSTTLTSQLPVPKWHASGPPATPAVWAGCQARRANVDTKETGRQGLGLSPVEV